MGLIIENGTEGTRYVAELVIIDRASMVRLEMDFESPRRPKITIVWDMGYMSEKDGFQATERGSVTIDDSDDVKKFLARTVTAGNTYAKELEVGVFAYLQDSGLVGRGVVEAEWSSTP